jgi:hypothetical protein
MKYNFLTIIAAGVILVFGVAQAQYQAAESVQGQTGQAASMQQDTGASSNVAPMQEMPVQQKTQAQQETQVRSEEQTATSARLQSQCGQDNDCSSIICPQVVGQDTPQCNLKTNTCFCGPGSNEEEPVLLPGQALIHSQLQVAQREAIRQPVIMEEPVSSTAEELQQITIQHQQTFNERKVLLQAQAEQRIQAAEEKALSLRAQNAEEIEAKKQQFQERVMQMTEERYQQAATNVSERVNAVNQNMTKSYFNYLDAIEMVLDKIEARAQIVGDATGSDMTAFLEEIASANIYIEQAREAVIAQKSKEYVAEIDSETTLGDDMSAIMQELRSDHASLRDNVLDPVRHLVRDLTQVLHDTVAAAGEEAEETLNLQVE